MVDLVVISPFMKEDNQGWQANFIHVRKGYNFVLNSSGV